jgi:hypothetical protein
VGLGPAAGRAFVEELVAVRALPTGDDPRRDLVGKVAGVAMVVQGEPFEGLIADA